MNFAIAEQRYQETGEDEHRVLMEERRQAVDNYVEAEEQRRALEEALMKSYK